MACQFPVSEFANKRILLIGEVMLDVYLKGDSRRLCPEAPVPVVDVTSRTATAGGAANCALNLRSLGANVIFCSVAGEDAEGEEVMKLLRQSGITTQGILRESKRRTLVKTRVMSSNQLMTRLDHGHVGAVTDETTQRLIEIIREAYVSCDAVIISDYNKGMITLPLVNAIISLNEAHNKCVAIDSKRLSFFRSLKPCIVKPNFDEATALLNFSPEDIHDRVSWAASFGGRINHLLQSKITIVSLDGDGSLIFMNGDLKHRCFARPTESPFVSGAGDTFLCAFTLSYCATNDPVMSAEIATDAAAVVVRKKGTSTCSLDELSSQMEGASKHVRSLTQLQEISEHFRHNGKRIVFTNGCFDIIHSGHVTFLHCAKNLGDVLIVGINKDESIRRIKGPDRPVNTLDDRIKVLSALSSVDYVIPFGDPRDDTPMAVIEAVRPHIFVKGGDYSRKQLPEAPTVFRCGGEIAILPLIPNHSTTNIINRITSPERKNIRMSSL